MFTNGISSTAVAVAVAVVVAAAAAVVVVVVVVVTIFRTLLEVVPPNKSQELGHKTEGIIFHQHVYTLPVYACVAH